MGEWVDENTVQYAVRSTALCISRQNPWHSDHHHFFLAVSNCQLNHLIIVLRTYITKLDRPIWFINWIADARRHRFLGFPISDVFRAPIVAWSTPYLVRYILIVSSNRQVWLHRVIQHIHYSSILRTCRKIGPKGCDDCFGRLLEM